MSYRDSGVDEFGRLIRTSKKTEERAYQLDSSSNYHNRSSTDQDRYDSPNHKIFLEAKEIQIEKESLERELAGLLQRKQILTQQIHDLSKKLLPSSKSGSIVSESSHDLDQSQDVDSKRGLKRDHDSAGVDAPTSSSEPLDTQSTDSNPNKKFKNSEDQNESLEQKTSQAPPTNTGASRHVLRQPLFQKLLMGTLKKSQKHIEMEKSDKTYQAKMEIERKTQEKLDEEAKEAQLKAERQAETQLQAAKADLEAIQTRIDQIEPKVSDLVYEEHEKWMKGNWLITKTEPKLMFVPAKYDSSVEELFVKHQSESRDSLTVKVVQKGKI